MSTAARNPSHRPRVGISSCLLGVAVRYDGGHKRSETIVQRLGPHLEWVEVCPEFDAGMGVPRQPVRLLGAGGPDDRMVGVEDGADWTTRLLESARRRLGALGPIDGWILKSRSPSCGLAAPRFAERTAAEAMTTAPGLFAGLLLELHPGLPVVEDENLIEAQHCRRFLDAVEARRAARVSGCAATETDAPSA